MNFASDGRSGAARSPGDPAAAFAEVLRRHYVLLAALLIAGAGIFHLLTLRPGLTWDGDYALYIMHAINIVHGTPYTETGFLLNPHNPSWPASYPPGLPLLLAPVYALFGLDIEAMKVELILCFFGFLAVFAAIARRALPGVPALCTVAVLAFNPFIAAFKNSIFSEFPFLLMGYLALHLADRLDGNDGPGAPARIPVIAAAGLALGFAFEIRTVGVVLFCAVAAVAVLRLRSAGSAPLAGVLIIGSLTAWSIGSLFPADTGTYLRYFEDETLFTLLEGPAYYALALVGVLDLGRLPAAIAWLTGGILAVLTALGWTARVRARITVFEVFAAGYAAFLLIYPIKEEPARYALPLLPMLFLYAFQGADGLGRAAGRLPAWLPAAAVFGLFAMAYVPALISLTRAELPGSPTSATVRAFFDEVRALVPEDAVITTADPTIVALFTGRRATQWNRHHDDDVFWEDLAAFGSAYLIENRVFGPRGDSFPFMEENTAEMDVLLRKGGLVLYRLRRPAVAARPSPARSQRPVTRCTRGNLSR